VIRPSPGIWTHAASHQVVSPFYEIAGRPPASTHTRAVATEIRDIASRILGTRGDDTTREQNTIMSERLLLQLTAGT